MPKLVFLDTETTSLRYDRQAWEVALIVRDGNGEDAEYRWFINADDLDLGNADLMSLKIGHFYERHPYALQLLTSSVGVSDTGSESFVMSQVEELTRGAHLVGAVPNFDAEVLANRMRDNGLCPSWHYHLIDVETLAAGHRRLAPPWGFDDILAMYDLFYDEADRHTALGDARMARDLYDAIMGGPAEPNADGSGR